jgi:hypothetical protein
MIGQFIRLLKEPLKRITSINDILSMAYYLYKEVSFVVSENKKIGQKVTVITVCLMRMHYIHHKNEALIIKRPVHGSIKHRMEKNS